MEDLVHEESSKIDDGDDEVMSHPSEETNDFMKTLMERREQTRNTLESTMAQRHRRLPPLKQTHKGQQVDVVDVEGPSALTASIRERMRQRVREASAKSQSTGTEIRPRRLRSLRQRGDVQTRFDEPSVSVFASTSSPPPASLRLPSPPDDKDEIVEEPEPALERWKRAIEKTRPTRFAQSEAGIDESAYDFFTSSIEGGPEALEEEEVEEQRQVSQERQIAETDLEAGEGDEEQYVPLTVRGHAEYHPHGERLKVEEELYFYPSSDSARLEDKLPEETEARHLEDEGLYVGKRPPVSWRNYNRLENRLLRQEDKGRAWFAEDGRLSYVPDPLKKPPSRPHVHIGGTDDEKLDTEVKLPLVETFDHRFIDGSGLGFGCYQLDVDISSLAFSHHSLFSVEHVLASRLSQLYSQYVERREKGIVTFMEDRLKALREASRHLQETLGPVDPEPGTVLEEQFHRLREYKSEIRRIRLLKDSEEVTDKKIIKSILKYWNNLKAVRQEQGYNATSLKLVIRKEGVSARDDEAAWQRAIDEEVEELREEYQEEYAGQLMEYQRQMDEYRKERKLIRQEMKRRRRETQEEEGRTFDRSAALREPVRPDGPAPFDEAAARRQVVEKAMENRRHPGQPKLFPILDSSALISASQQCPREEQLRRRDVQRCSYCIRVLFNKREVSRTATKTLSGDFTVHFGQIFNIQIRQWPESISLQLYESRSGSSGGFGLIAEVYVPIPPSQLHSGNVALENIDFSSPQKVEYAHTGVGSGINVDISSSGLVSILLTSGALRASACWSKDDATGKILSPPMLGQPTHFGERYVDAIAALGATGMVDIQKLATWISEAQLDPNDPRNADLLYLVKTHAGDDPSCLAKQDYFRLNEMEKDSYFCEDDYLEKSKRFQLLALRDQEARNFSGFKMVPANDSEIKDSIFTDLASKEIEEEELDPHKLQRFAVTNFFKEVQSRVIDRSQRASRHRELRDVVIEEEVPNIGILGQSIVKLLAPRRPLKPERKERKTIFTQAGGVSDIKLLVRLVRAFNVPIRERSNTRLGARSSGQGGRDGDPSSDFDLTDQVQVRPFVEVSFQQSKQLTPVADGPNPSWNSEMSLPFMSPNHDYSPVALQGVTDLISFNLFDEILVDLLEDDRQRETNRHERIERRWLGNLSVPFSTVYSNTRVDGTFQVSVPSVLLGYKKDDSRATEVASASDFALMSHSQTFLSLFITIEPPLPPLPTLREQYDSNEDPRLLRTARAWSDALERKFKKRRIQMTVMDINIKTVFITRYVRSQNPPEGILANVESGSLAAMEKVAWYVAMIPSLADAVAFRSNCDIWATSEQFLMMQAGDEEEHAVLLCNYFLFMGKKAWVVLGSGIPEGSTAYVLTEDQGDQLSGEYWLWNPSTGKRFHQFDPYCPLQTVDSVFGTENIWVNVQDHQKPSFLNFNLSLSRNWRPFFSKRYPNPGLSSVQGDLTYKPPDESLAKSVEEKIERLLKKRFEESRRHVTRWNRHCIAELRKFLPRLEERPFDSASVEDQKLQLASITGSDKLSGFPLHFAFTDVDSIVNSVLDTRLHTIEDPQAEFALAVYVEAYPSDVLSVWVYVVGLTKRLT
ncbi:coiled-coil and C2 domain-containing protein 2A-like [Oscarella lobularis]|uniref:coiled-coil and C2 domain-containing protein 2A-like n=1 Tax=Oscarella lobularis TaxID=121494 RepID=UPI0033144B46